MILELVQLFFYIIFELFEGNSTRLILSSVSISAYNLLGFLFSAFYLPITGYFGPVVTFSFFATVIGVFGTLIILYSPETKNIDVNKHADTQDKLLNEQTTTSELQDSTLPDSAGGEAHQKLDDPVQIKIDETTTGTTETTTK